MFANTWKLYNWFWQKVTLCTLFRRKAKLANCRIYVRRHGETLRSSAFFCAEKKMVHMSFGCSSLSLCVHIYSVQLRFRCGAKSPWLLFRSNFFVSLQKSLQEKEGSDNLLQNRGKKRQPCSFYLPDSTISSLAAFIYTYSEPIRNRNNVQPFPHPKRNKMFTSFGITHFLSQNSKNKTYVSFSTPCISL